MKKSRRERWIWTEIGRKELNVVKKNTQKTSVVVGGEEKARRMLATYFKNEKHVSKKR